MSEPWPDSEEFPRDLVERIEGDSNPALDFNNVPAPEVVVAEVPTTVKAVRKPRAKKPVEPKPPAPAPVLTTAEVAALFVDLDTIELPDGKHLRYESRVGEIPGQVYVRTAPLDEKSEPIAAELHEYVFFVRQLS